MAIVKLSTTERRRLSVFFTCLGLAIVAWIFTTLSSPLPFAVNEALVYKNSPQKRAFHPLQTDSVKATIQGTGWQMLFSKLKPENKPIIVDLAPLDTRNYVVLSSQLKVINSKRDANQQITAIDPDTLYFDFTNRLTKKVPVRALLGIEYQKQFAISGNVSIKPAYVTISGPADRLQKIGEWKTDSIKAADVNETIIARVNLQPVSEGNLTIYPKNVQVVVPVDEFTEKTLDIPVKLINNHNYDNVKVFPQKVKVTFTTSLNRYKDMSDDLFEATADLDLWRDHGYSTLPVQLTRFPPFCKIVRVSPANIDFIIKK
ncbi:YbbR-like domain-containing protein [Mucilaginibacter sp. KACC 22773]|uniref:CdaR family protein n=1 Tax=Mucilaginibacter sp. KACC 22773 TaxID=3025671 RepID=UPI002366BE5A|nr:YbbR-like domain-containing protein [Mucilaginibacter sp. KACC 22773]WDF76008.1 YbbR-like domain-containing protein [Mucilaginibacter sp. KACC 22773]